MKTLPRDAIEEVRQRCIDAALSGYDDAMMSGLCREGAWEAAMSAIQRLDLDRISEDTLTTPAPNDVVATDEELTQHCVELARMFSSAGPPAAGSAAAVTGAIAAGLLEWVARHSADHGPEASRSRARQIQRRAFTLESSLASAAEHDASVVASLVGSDDREESRRPLLRATESALAIATRCSQVATLAAELAPHAHRSSRPDLDVALRLGWSASQSALDLFEANRPIEQDGSDWFRDVNRRAWRARLLLRRAAVRLRSADSE